MDAWWPLLTAGEFKPALGKKAFEQLESMLSVGDHTGGSPEAPDFYNGWWGYVSKDLRDHLSARSQGAATAASTAAAARSRSAGRCCSGPWRRRPG